MVGFSNSESPEDFKHRLNFLTEKLNKTDKTSDRAPNKTKAET
jgi:hypothetical protein